MKYFTSTILFLFCLIFEINHAQVLITPAGSISENFNSLASARTNTWTDNSTIPTWLSQRTGTGTTYVASIGNSNAGGLYSFGSTVTPTDRALGSLGSSTSSFSTELLIDDVEFTSWGTGLETTVTAVDQPLLNNYPNPFASNTVINYSLAIPSENVNLNVVDINGKQVFTQTLGKQNAGEITLNFDGSNLKEGIYFYTVTSDNNRQTGKMMISK